MSFTLFDFAANIPVDPVNDPEANSALVPLRFDRWPQGLVASLPPESFYATVGPFTEADGEELQIRQPYEPIDGIPLEIAVYQKPLADGRPVRNGRLMAIYNHVTDTANFYVKKSITGSDMELLITVSTQAPRLARNSNTLVAKAVFLEAAERNN